MLGNGDVFAGFIVERLLGQGGMGAVYLARHPRLNRQTAVKLLNPELFADNEVRARFEREADLVAQLEHPNIVGVYDRGVEDQQLWISMQYVDGVDAATVDPRTLPPERAVQIIEGVAAALDYAHGQGVLHRDVKPANILLGRAAGGKGERVYLTDFGIARLREDSTHLTQDGMFTATLAYASPEQMTGGTLDNRSDQYALACALYWLLTGTGPFDSEDPSVLIHGHLQLPVPPIGPRRPGLPQALDAVLARGMAKLAADRYPSCQEFAAAARAALTAPDVPVMPAAAAPFAPTRGMHPGVAPGVPVAPGAQQVGPGVPLAPGSPQVAGVPVMPGSPQVGAAVPVVPGAQQVGPGMPGGAPGAPAGIPPSAPGVPVPPGAPNRRFPALRRNSNLPLWILLGAVLLVAAALILALIGIGASSHDSDRHRRQPLETVGGPTPGAPVSPPGAAAGLSQLQSAFPQLVQPNATALSGPGYDGQHCFTPTPGHLNAAGDDTLRLGAWTAAWDCSAEPDRPTYAVLSYRSADDARAVLQQLPPNERVEGAEARASIAFQWPLPNANLPGRFWTVLSFPDPAHANYLVLAHMENHTGGDNMSAADFTQWWRHLPV